MLKKKPVFLEERKNPVRLQRMLNVSGLKGLLKLRGVFGVASVILYLKSNLKAADLKTYLHCQEDA